jgi:hypothetical protein
MKYTYEEVKNDAGVVICITRLEDLASIPLDPANSDYQRYLNPEAEQSTQPIGGNK